jgi:FkbM family methyltransferase
LGDQATRPHPNLRDIKPAVRGWVALQRARLAHRRHPDLGEISAHCFYATKLHFRDLAFDIGANAGGHTAAMLSRGARVVAVEPQSELADQLTQRFPAATVLPVAVSDTPGQAVLHLVRESDDLASLDPGWHESWHDSTPVPVTTLDKLIDEYGEPSFVRIDTEGFDHRVLQGLTRPIEHILFEVNVARRREAAEAFTRLEELGHYEYRMSRLGSWLFSAHQRPEEILADLRDWGAVYARRLQ